MKIIHVIDTLGFGGAESMLINTIEKSPGIIHYKVFILGKNTPRAEYLSNLGVSVERVTWFNFFFKIYREKPDLLMGWLFKSTLICALAKQIFGHRIKIVWNIRYSSFPNSDVKSRLIVQILKIFSSTVEAIVYNSFVGRRHHESLGYKNKNSIVIGNGFDIEKYQPQPHLKQEFLMNKELEKNSFIFGMVARYDKLKNQKNFILAALEFLDNIKETKGPIYFVFAGKEMNWQNQELIKILDGHPKSYRFLFLDAQNRTQFLYPCFDINCLYSLTEGFPNVIGESMCCGIPSIASDVGDVKRLMENSGWLVSLDSKSELITAFTKAYYANTSDLRELGEQARKNICENYSIEKITNDYIHLFEMIIGK